MKRGELLFLADSVRADRLIGTQSHWWRDRMSLHLEDMERHGDPQDVADKRRIMRLAAVETAFLHLMDKSE